VVRLVLLAILLSAAVSGAMCAQDPSDLAAYRALTQTPLAGLIAPTGPAVSGEPSGWGWHVQYGLRSLDDHEYTHTAGAGIQLPVGRGRIDLTAGAYLPACSDGECPGHFMTSAGFAERLVGIGLGRDSSSATLNIATQLELGLGFPAGATLFAASATIPMSLVPTGEGLRLLPYLAPGLGSGLVSENGETEAGLRGQIGAGVSAVGLLKGFTLTAGIERVLLQDGNWLVGLSLLRVSPK
jgi:hypothetical protein